MTKSLDSELVESVLLKRTAALLVTTRSDQPVARKLTRAMTDVFEQWLPGTARAQARKAEPDDDDLVREVLEEKGVRQPIVVFHDGKLYWVADGHHRTKAAREAGLEKISALVHEGGQREALLYATGANAEHGHRRTNADKRNAVMVLLCDSKWGRWNNTEIARQAKVSDRFVGLVRRDLSPNHSEMPSKRKVQRGDTIYEQDTANIGKRSSISKQPELPGTARTQARKLESDDDDLVREVLAEGSAGADPINASSVAFAKLQITAPKSARPIADPIRRRSRSTPKTVRLSKV